MKPKMPNWCDGELKITGKEGELQGFKKFAKTGTNVLDTHKFIPYPKEFKEQDILSNRYHDLKRNKQDGKLTKKETRELLLMSLNPPEKDGFNSGGYDWCLQNWGTKWGICNPELYNLDDKQKLFYRFNTAWSPASIITCKMAELFPKLKFNYKYWEGGSEFRGIFICKNKKIIRDNVYNYKGFRGG